MSSPLALLTPHTTPLLTLHPQPSQHWRDISVIIPSVDKYGGVNTPEARADVSKWVLWVCAYVFPCVRARVFHVYVLVVRCLLLLLLLLREPAACCMRVFHVHVRVFPCVCACSRFEMQVGEPISYTQQHSITAAPIFARAVCINGVVAVAL